MKKLHLLCNAHLDPVWQWLWQEGVGAAITTFSAAADFCEEFGDFVFCHNEAILYKWVEENDKELFGRIRRLVAAGKWHIMGGWYLQPDCNMPNGESFIRQIRAGLDYFESRFPGFKRPEIAVNFDSFGHTNGLVQILRDSGYKGYICMRPDTDEADRNMLWKGFAGSEIVVYRVYKAYNTLLGQVDKRLEPFLKNSASMETGLFLWGVGNHGGGPSRQDYRTIEGLKAKYPEIEIVHSTPEAYFGELAGRESLKETERLNYVNMGCYASMIRIKQLHQRLENELDLAEKMVMHARLSGGEIDRAAFERIEEDLMFCQFHDILPGSCIKSAEEDALMQLSHGITEAQKLQARAFFVLSGGQKKAAAGEYPILVYNPHPFPVVRDVECEFMLADQNWSEEEFYDAEVSADGKKLPAQMEKESSNVPLDWRKKLVFTLEMTPFSMNRVSVFTSLKKRTSGKSGEIGERFVFDNGRLKACLDGRSGRLEFLSVDGKEYLRDSGRIRVIRNCCDPWGFHYDDYREELGEFTLLGEAESASFAGVTGASLSPVRIIEDGEVRTVTESLLGYGTSRAVIRYVFPKKGTAVRIHLDVFNNEKDVKLKFALNTALKNAELKGGTAFGEETLPQNGGEAVAQDYVLLLGDDRAVSAIHFGTYGLSAEGGEVAFTLLNSAAYCAHPVDDRTIMRDDRFGARIDQGERHYDFELNFSERGEREEKIGSESRVAHEAPYALSFFPTGNGSLPRRFIEISRPEVILSAVRPSRDGKDILIRLYNSLDRPVEADVSMPFIGSGRTLRFKGYQFRSFIVGGESWEECNCLGEKLGKKA